MILGLTGGIATGKSTAVNFFKRMGIKIIEADLIARDVTNDKKIIEKIIEVFGKEILKKNKLDRQKMREIVFSDEEKLEKLNEITHPEIIKKLLEEIEKNKNEKLFILDIPLLYETEFEKYTDKVLLINCIKDIELNRLMERDNISYELAINMINSQMSMKEKLKKADFIIDNNASLEEFYDKLEKFYIGIK